MNSIHLINTLALSAPHRFPLPQSHSPLRSPAVSKRQRFSPSAGFRLVSAQTVNSVPVSLVFVGSSLFITLHVLVFSYIGFVFRFSARMEVIRFQISWRRSRIYMLLKPLHRWMKVLFVIASMLLYDPMVTLYAYTFFFDVVVLTALEALVRNRISGLPVVDDDWNLVLVQFTSIMI